MIIRFLIDILLGNSQSHPTKLSAFAGDEEESYVLTLPNKEHLLPGYTIIDVPSYQNLALNDSLFPLKTLISPLYPGFLINLVPFDSFPSYFEAHFSGQGRRRNFSRQRKKLEKEINPVRKQFHEATNDTIIDALFGRLHHFLEKRFEQKEAYNYEIPLLPLYREMFRILLPAKKAIIFSMYDQEKAIAIGIGFIQDKTLYLFNIAFDIDYAHFGLGNQMMIDVVKWCFDNRITKVDMGRGDFLHKRHWVNSTYTYRQVNIYNPKIPSSIIRAHGAWALNNLRYFAIHFLKRLKVQHLAKILFLWRYRINNLFRKKKG